MRARSVKSPNRADAANYAVADLSFWTGRLPVGAIVAQERDEVPDWGFQEYARRPGMPIW